MTWIETTSLTFTARHEEGDRSYAEELLDRLEDLSLKLEDRFEVVPGDISIVIHPSPVWLTAAHPFLPFVRYAAAPAGRVNPCRMQPLRNRCGGTTTREAELLRGPWP